MRVRRPVDSSIAKWVYRHLSQDVCPWNQRFATPNNVPDFAPREFLADKDARTIARDILEMTQAEFSAAFKGSPMKRAKLRGLKRNAALVLGNVGIASDIEALTSALDYEEPLVREHAAWALAQLRSRARDGTDPSWDASLENR